MHEQAFHTCCRHGLSPQPGFQFNAASPGLEPRLLEDLAAVLAGYQPPPHAPLQPTREELSRFPVALRYRSVGAIGPAVSRTAYVGQEFRGSGDAPDSGRFGNYFSHIILGNGTDDPFDGLLPIELWDARHWSTSEVTGQSLEPLGSLMPGPLHLAHALSLLGSGRAAWIPQVIEAVVRALDGGPRVVLVEEGDLMAAAWIALVSYVLPRTLVNSLSFSTFEGRPRYADVRVCVTAPDCDVAFGSHELGQQVTLLDLVAERPAPDAADLLGRIVGLLTPTGDEALAGAVRVLEREDAQDPQSLGAAMAMLTGSVHTAHAGEERCDILNLLVDWLTRELAARPLGDAARALSEYAGEPSEGEFTAWMRLHAIARGSTHKDAPAIVSAALAVLIRSSHRIGEEAPLVAAGAPVRPPVSRLAEWLETVTSEQDIELFARKLDGGWRMGLVGQNAELDRQLAMEVAPRLGATAVRDTFHAIVASSRQDELLRTVGETLAALSLDDPNAMEALVDLTRVSEIERVVRNYAQREDSFATWLVALQLRLRHHPEERSAAASSLVGLIVSQEHERRLRGLYGADGPSTSAEHAELLRAYAAARKSAPSDDVAAASEHLGRCSLVDDSALADAVPLADALIQTVEGTRESGIYVAWRMASNWSSCLGSRTRGRSLMQWMSSFDAVLRYHSGELPDERISELQWLTTQLVLQASPKPAHCQAFDMMLGLIPAESWLSSCEEGLLQSPFDGDSTYFAELFVAWYSTSARSRLLVLDRLLPNVLGGWSPRRREKLRKRLPSDFDEAWSEWEERHWPPGAISRTIGRLRGASRDAP